MHLDALVGTPSAPRPAASIPAAAQHAARRGAGVIGLPDPDHRAERDGRPGLADAVVGGHRGLSRERARPRDGADAGRRAAVPAGARHALPAEPRGRCRSLVAPARDGVGHRARGLRVGAEDLLGGRAARVARAARLVPHGARVVPRDQRARRPARPHARLPVGHRLRGARGAPADRQLARDRQARGTRGEGGRGRARRRDRLVVGLGDVRLGRAPTPTRRSPPAPTCGRAIRLCATCSPRSTAISTRSLDEGQIELAAGVQCTDRDERRRSRPRRSTASRRSRAAGRRRSVRCSCATSCAAARPPQLAIRRAGGGDHLRALQRLARALRRRAREARRDTRRRPRRDRRRPAACRPSRAGCTCRRRPPRRCAPGGRRTAARACARDRARSRSRWLGNSRTGIALPGSDAPPQVLRARSGQTLRVPTRAGHRAHHGRQPRSRCARPQAADANPAVSALIRAAARDAAGARWLAGAASKALDDGDLPARPASVRRRRRTSRRARRSSARSAERTDGAERSARWWSLRGRPRAAPPPPRASSVPAASTGAASCPRR